MRRFFINAKINSEVVLEGMEHNHLKNVLRINVGEEVIVTCGDEFDYTCRVEKINKNNTILSVIDKQINEYNPKSQVTVFQALTKQDNMALIVQKLSELGVTKLVPFVSKFITSKDSQNKQDKLQTIANQSTKQCKRSIPLEVSKPLKFSEMLKELKGFDMVIFANETETTKDLDSLKIAGRVAIIVGSEGGFDKDECDMIAEAGAYSVSLGKRILRAETASIALTSVVMYRLGEWKR